MARAMISGFRSSVLAVLVASTAIPASLGAKPAPRSVPSPQIVPLPLKQIIPVRQRLCAAKTATGLGYSVLRSGTGARPAAGGMVRVNYLGYLAASGEVFDQGMASEFPLNGVIPGFSEGLAMMPAGSIYRLCIPAQQAYGDKTVGPIPPRSDLVFQVELLAPAPAASAR